MKSKRLIPVLLSTILFLNVGIPTTTVFADNITTSTSDSSQLEYSETESSQAISKIEESFSIEENIIVSEEKSETIEHSHEDEQSESRITSPNPEIQEMIDALTEIDLQNAVGEDGLGEKQHAHDYSVARSYSSSRYENVNNYIKKKNFKTPAIQRDSRFGTTPRYNYKIGKPIGVVVHETANPNSTIQGEINYMYNNYQNAFVHAFTDNNSIIETAPTDYLAWGAGPHANPYFMHIELVEVKTFDEFARSVNNDAYWIATQLKKYGLQPTLADRNNGVGSVISHNAVSNYYGGTNHTDPTGYFASWGYNMDQFFELIEYHYYGNNTGAKPSEPEKYEIFDKDLSIIPGTLYNIHTKPYPYDGYQITGNIENIQGKQVHVNMKSKTSAATYYNVNGLGWINAKAFRELTSYNIETSQLDAKITSATALFYKEPFNTMGTERTGVSSSVLYQQDVKITKKATKGGIDYHYYVDGYGWLGKNDVSLYESENYTNVNLNFSIIPGVHNIYSKPYPYKDSSVINTTKDIQGKQIHVSKKSTTSDGLYYYVDNHGWLNSKHLRTLETYNYPSFNREAKVISNTALFYKEPFNTMGTERTGVSSSVLYQQDVKITKKATKGGVDSHYYIDGYGWLGKNDVSLYEPENYTNVNLNFSIIPGVHNFYSKPYPYKGNTVIDTTKNIQGKQIHVSKKSTTSDGLYYYVDNHGWLNSKHLRTLETYSYSSFNRDAKVISNTALFYKEPFNTMGTERTGVSSSVLYQQDVKITKKATKGGVDYHYYIDGYGWLGKNDVYLYDVPVYEKLNMRLTVKPNAYYNIHSLPYAAKGYKILGDTRTQNMRGKTYQISKMATTTRGVYYEVPNYGWISRDAFSSDIEKYNKVQKLLNNKYSSGNYGVYVKSLSSNASAGVFQDTRYTAASTGKLPAIYYTQKRYNNKTLNPNSQFLYTDAINQMNESYGRGGAGILQNKPFGGMYSIDTILNWTIYYSDNQGANFLGYYAANKYSKDMKNEISQIIGRQWDSPFSITAKENGKLMEAIYKQGGNANKYLQNTGFDNQRIPKYLPINVGHKIGDVFDYRHDVAIVYAKEPYILSVMTKNYQSYESISNLSLEIYNILK